jgi:hypothetical protein
LSPLGGPLWWLLPEKWFWRPKQSWVEWSMRFIRSPRSWFCAFCSVWSLVGIFLPPPRPGRDAYGADMESLHRPSGTWRAWAARALPPRCQLLDSPRWKAHWQSYTTRKLLTSDATTF